MIGGFRRSIFRDPVVNTPVGYLLEDRFQADLAAGMSNGTAAFPGPGTRTVTEVGEAVHVISGGKLTVAVPSVPAHGNFWMVYADVPILREFGRVLITRTFPAAGLAYLPAWVNTAVGLNFGATTQLGHMGSMTASIRVVDGGGASKIVATNSSAIYYWTAFILRATGAFFLIKGGTFTNWTLLWASNLDSDSPLYVATYQYNYLESFDIIRVPSTLIPIYPVASDSFTRADGALGSTDGAGHAEASGGDGLIWTAQAGTVQISTNKAICSALSGGVGIVTVNTGVYDGIFDATPTKATTGAGMVLRYVDADNYLYAYYNGASLIFTKRVAGVETNLLTAAAAGGNSKELRVQLIGTTARAYYNDVKIGADLTVPVSTATKHGLYFLDGDSVLDNFVVWSAGTEGRYSELDTYCNTDPFALIHAPFDNFMIAVVPDSQLYVELGDEDTWYAMCQYIADHASELGIRIVFHLGDLVAGNTAEQWGMATHGFDILDAANLPYLLSIGNHDYDNITTRATATWWNGAGRFPQSRYTGKSWWSGGFYEAGHSENAYLLMSINGVDYIFFTLEFGPRQGVLDWCNTLLTTYASRKAIILTHSYLYYDGTRVTTGDASNPHSYGIIGDDVHDGEEMWPELKVNNNIILIISAHHTQAPFAAHRVDNSDGGQPVSQVFANWQGLPTNGDGMMRFITVNPTAETMKHQSWSPISGETAPFDGSFMANY